MSSNGSHSHSHEPIPMSKLVSNMIILAILMVLTIVAGMLPTWVPSLYEPLKNAWFITNTVAVGIACWKAYLVVSVFMGVRYSTKLVKFYAIGGFVWFLMLFLILFDYIARPQGGDVAVGWEPAAATALQGSYTVKEGEEPPVVLPGRVRYGDYLNPEPHKVKHKEGEGGH